MKKCLIVLALLVLGSVAPVYSQDGFTIDVPFSFTAGDKTFGPGQYTIRLIADRFTAQICANDGDDAGFAQTFKTERSSIPEVITQWTPGAIGGYGKAGVASSNQVNNQPVARTIREYSVVFNKYGDQYFATKMWLGLEGREFLKGRTERDLLASNPVFEKHETVVLLAH